MQAAHHAGERLEASDEYDVEMAIHCSLPGNGKPLGGCQRGRASGCDGSADAPSDNDRRKVRHAASLTHGDDRWLGEPRRKTITGFVASDDRLGGNREIRALYATTKVPDSSRAISSSARLAGGQSRGIDRKPCGIRS